MDYDYQIYHLSAQFMNDYPDSQYPELMEKAGRPYACLLIETHEDYYICIPYRSSIGHNNAYLFRGTTRSQTGRSGLDYSKTVIIQNTDYISTPAIIDSDEYTATVKALPRIVNEINAYIDAYKKHVSGVKRLHPSEYYRKYGKSTLPYFHKELGL